MKTSELFLAIRYDIGDIDGSKVSPYQLLNAFNGVMRAVTTALNNTTLNQKQVTLTMTDGSSDLPADFDSPVLVKGSWPLASATPSEDINQYNYRIVGDKLYAAGDVTLVYNPSFTSFSLDSNLAPTPDTISWPDSLFNTIKTRTVAVVGNNSLLSDAAFLASMAQEISNKVSMREKTFIYRKPLIKI